MIRSKERVHQMNEVIRGIAQNQAYKFKGITQEDLAQSLWIYILDIEEKAQEDLDLSLIAFICYKKIGNIQRREMRFNSLYLEDINPNFDTSDRDNYYEFEILNIKEFIEQFPEGSKERIYLEYWAASVNLDILDSSKYIKSEDEAKGKYKGGYTEDDLAKTLGYVGCSSSGYKVFRERIRKKVEKYFKNL